MVAQRIAGVVLTVDAAFLQFRDYVFHEILEGSGLMGWPDDEAVTGGSGKPFFHHVGDFRRTADPFRVEQAAPRDPHEVPHGRVLDAGRRDSVAEGVHALDTGDFLFGERLVQPFGREIVS